MRCPHIEAKHQSTDFSIFDGLSCTRTNTTQPFYQQKNNKYENKTKIDRHIYTIYYNVRVTCYTYQTNTNHTLFISKEHIFTYNFRCISFFFCCVSIATAQKQEQSKKKTPKMTCMCRILCSLCRQREKKQERSSGKRIR